MALPPPAPSSVALITGASSGIGAAIARELAGRGHNVALVARRRERLDELAGELGEKHGVRAEAIGADLASDAGRDAAISRLAELELDVEVLVNNAGFGGFGAGHKGDAARQADMVRLNCVALVDLQARLTPAMAERGRGAVLNVASTAAFQPLPGSATYAASKAFVLSLSEATHAELAPAGVTVTALCPGPVRTEFVEIAGAGSAEESLPEPFWMSAEAVARQAVEGLARGKRVVVPGVLNRAGALGGQHAPRALLLPAVGRLYGRIL